MQKIDYEKLRQFDAAPILEGRGEAARREGQGQEEARAPLGAEAVRVAG